MSKVNEKDAAAAATPETSVEEKTNLAVFLGSSSSDVRPAPAMPFTPGSVFHANPCHFFLSMAGLLNVWLHDPSIKDIAKQIEKDPSFKKMAEQFRQAFHGGDDGVRQFDMKQQYFFTMEQLVMQNPQLMKMAKSLDTFIMQDPSLSQMLESLSNPAQKEQLEERMARIKENPSLKPILEEIESGGPTAMMRYWNDEDVLKKVGEAIGLVTDNATACVGHLVANARKKLQQLDEEVKARKAELMSIQKQQQLKEDEVKAKKVELTSMQEESHQFDMDCEASRAEFMSILEQHQLDEQYKTRLMKIQEQHLELHERRQLLNHAVFTRSQSVATAEQVVGAEKQRTAAAEQSIAANEQRIAALEPMIAAVEQEITMANDRTESTRALVGVSFAVTMGVFSHVYR